MRKMTGILLVVCLVGWLYPGRSAAYENTFETVFKDGFYGGLAGALVGGAVLVFQDKPGDHLNYLSYGAAIGVLVGVTFGVVGATRSMAEIDDHKLVFHLPVPQAEVLPLGLTRRELITSMDLLTVRF
ncbi:MAG: hypothetical protein HY204_04375 [Nitrospirae bacterium]|nr:hypothetical protein [Nitrospirota bacterium]